MNRKKTEQGSSKLLLIIIPSICLVLLMIFYALIRDMIRPPLTAGWTPKEVVIAYYGAINDRNYPLLDDILARGAPQEDLKAVQYLYIVTTEKDTMFGSKGLYPAEDFEKEGYPELPEFTKVFGITGLEIKETDPLTYRVTFRKWFTAIDNDDRNEDSFFEQKVVITGNRVEDIVTLKEFSRSYRIVDIQRSESTFYERECIWKESGMRHPGRSLNEHQ